jgi:rhodanese-related sulfurtransferase
MQAPAGEEVQIREVTTHEVLRMQRYGSPVVDVREPEEFADGHIPGAVNVPLAQLETGLHTHPEVVRRALLAHELRERPLVLYCLVGGRSARGAAALRRLGYANPVSLAGGILAWTDEGHPIVVQK